MSDMLFDELPVALPPLRPDEQAMLDRLPYNEPNDCMQMIWEKEYATVRRLAQLGLVKIRYDKEDPIADYTVMYAGRIRPPEEER